MSIAEIESLAIFVFVFGGVAFRNVLRLKQPIWLFFLIGALATVALGVLTPQEAYQSIDLQVIIFLFSMFVIASALKMSGLLGEVGALISKRSRGWLSLVLFFLIFSLASAFLMNDPLAIIGTPVALYLSGVAGVEAFPFLLALAFAVTTGSEMTPMGNPQNLLVAVESGMRAPMIEMTRWLLLPTVVNLALALVVLRVAYRRSRLGGDPPMELPASTDARLRRVVIAAVAVTVIGLFVVNWLQLLGYNPPLDISGVALLGSAIVLGLGGKERELLYDVDWGVLVMFAGLFVVTQGMWDSGLVGAIASIMPPPTPGGSLALILLPSVILSQIISNVPMVALYMPLMREAGFGPTSYRAWAALAAGSTLAGNLTLMGAASNLIIVQEEERHRGKSSMDFWRFALYGLPLTALNCLVIYAFLFYGIRV